LAFQQGVVSEIQPLWTRLCKARCCYGHRCYARSTQEQCPRERFTASVLRRFHGSQPSLHAAGNPAPIKMQDVARGGLAVGIVRSTPVPCAPTRVHCVGTARHRSVAQPGPSRPSWRSDQPCVPATEVSPGPNSSMVERRLQATSPVLPAELGAEARQRPLCISALCRVPPIDDKLRHYW